MPSAHGSFGEKRHVSSVAFDLMDLARRWGPHLERAAVFPERTNVEFVAPQGGGFDAVVYERGVGITQACGTGAGAVLAAGALSGVSFVGLAFIVGRLLDSQTPAGSKAGLAGMLIAKMAVVAGGLYFLIVQVEISPLGTSFGIGAAILGLTIGLNRGTASPEGQAAMDAESRRIAEQMREESDSGSKE